ncbi:MAG: hypothetical protein RMJ33_09470 [Saprospiraceae bacterium]|nr:hypothetical protein [Saprospiraceae bacterium]MDW8230053.1 hypothetical protein [Saprospiraceae bacterium]
MRTAFSLLFFACFAASATWAQTASVTEIERAMSFGTRPGFAVTFVDTDVRLVNDVWNEFVKNNFGSKLKKGKRNEFTAPQSRSTSISTGTFTLYSELEKVGTGAQLNVWFDVGPFFLNRRDDPQRTDEALRLLRRFHWEVRKAVADNDVRAEENKMKELENKLRKLRRDNDNLNKDIANFEARLKKAREDLAQNEKDQEATLIDIERQRSSVEEAVRRRASVQSEQ